MSEKTFSSKSETSEEKQGIFLFWFFSWFLRRPGMMLLFILVSVLLPLVTLTLFVILPAMGFEPLPEATRAERDAEAKKTEITADLQPMLLDILQKEHKLNFLQNRLDLARQDSIYMVLNLQDSLLDIEIKGLPVQRCKLHQIDASNRIKVAQFEALQQWLSKPFTLKREFATIPKVPFLVVEAPKDTNEAAKLPKKPMEPEKTAVFFTLAFDRNLVLQVEQTEAVPPEEAPLVLAYQQKIDSVYGRKMIDRILQPMPDELPVFIRLKMNEGDARAIYRSIPHIGFAKLIINTSLNPS